ncbi:hypothetical protein DFQ28_001898 [Apophysomyces sp. BC1034]|nr:hypothetical protein DFQ28_001898 [Apophysomyces sp. BC1034]
MPKETQKPYKRVKVTLACIVCRKKKVKCDGVQPTCSRCESMGYDCEYSNPPRKRGPPKGYVEVIESRAHRIESLLGKDHRMICSESLPTCHASPKLLPHDNTFLSLVAGAIDALQTNAAEHCLMGSAGSNGIRYDSPPSAIPPDVSLPWVDNFFGHFNTLFPILSRPHFIHDWAHDPKTIDPLLLLSMYTIGCHYADNKNREDSQYLFKRCQHILNTSFDSPTLPTIQALAILCWYAFLVGDMQNSCLLQQQLVHSIHQLNLGSDPQPSIGILQMEIHRRTFWAAYVIDQWLATCISKSLLTGKWDCQWPQLEDDQLWALGNRTVWNREEQACYATTSALQIATFKEMIKLARIAGERHMATSDATLTEWLVQLPSYLEYGPIYDESPPSPMARIFRMLYYTIQILNNAPLADDQSRFRNSIRTTAANTIIHIAEQMLYEKQHKYLYNAFGLCVTLASSVHLSNLCLPEDMSAATITLGNSVRILKSTNCTLLPTVDFGQLVDRFIAERFGVDLKTRQGKPHKRTTPTTVATAPATDMHESSIFLNPCLRDSTGIDIFQSFYPTTSFDDPSTFLIYQSSSTPVESLGSSSSPCSFFSPTCSPNLPDDDNHVNLDGFYDFTMPNNFLL